MPLPGCLTGAGIAIGAVLGEHKSDWLVMDESMLTLDGTACNKIGVGYS